jgi:hypothetical protein
LGLSLNLGLGLNLGPGLGLSLYLGPGLGLSLYLGLNLGLGLGLDLNLGLQLVGSHPDIGVCSPHCPTVIGTTKLRGDPSLGANQPGSW